MATEHNTSETVSDITEEMLTSILKEAESDLQVLQAGAQLDGFTVHCNRDEAVANGLRQGKGIAVETFTSPVCREAKKLGPAARLKAAFQTANR